MSDWWNSLSLSEKKDYIKQHPRSKKKAVDRNKLLSSAGKTMPTAALTGKERNRVRDYLNTDNNMSAVRKNIQGSIDEMQAAFEHKIERLENKQLKTVYDNTIKAVKVDGDKASSNLKDLMSVSGIVLLSAGVLSLFAGSDLVSTAQVIVGGFGDEIKRHTREVQEEIRQLDVEEARDDFENDAAKAKHKAEIAERKRRAKINYLKRVHEESLKKAKADIEGDDVDSKERIVDSMVRVPAMSVETAHLSIAVASALQSTRTKNISMKEKITINSYHETDLLKALIKLEKADVAVKEGKEQGELLSHIDYLESCIPVAATIMVASIAKPTILSRAKIMLNRCNEQLASSKAILNRVAEAASIKKSSLDFFLKKNLKHSEYRFEKAYVREGDEVIACEHHILRGVESASHTHNKIEIYGFVTGNTINLSVVKDSNFMPKSFSSIKPRELSSWLKENV